jgi:hypothetical protein
MLQKAPSFRAQQVAQEGSRVLAVFSGVRMKSLRIGRCTNASEDPGMGRRDSQPMHPSK